MRKYQPRIHVLEVLEKNLPPEANLLDYIQTNRLRASTFSFSITSFITVTAYQNPSITRLKIQSNPFAKGDREIAKMAMDRFEKFIFHSSNPFSVCRQRSRFANEEWKKHHDASRPKTVPIRLIIPPTQNTHFHDCNYCHFYTNL